MRKISVFLLAMAVLTVASCSKTNIYVLGINETAADSTIWTAKDLMSAISVIINKDGTFTVINGSPFDIFFTGNICTRVVASPMCDAFELRISPNNGTLQDKSPEFVVYNSKNFDNDLVKFFTNTITQQTPPFYQGINIIKGYSRREFMVRGLALMAPVINAFILSVNIEFINFEFNNYANSTEWNVYEHY